MKNNFLSKNKKSVLVQKILLVFALFLGIVFSCYEPSPRKAMAYDFNPNNLISDGTFTNKNAMSEADIQSFLEQKGSLLKDFTQDGKRASKIIFEAARGVTSSGIWNNFGHPEWNEDVSINPQALLVTIQKEEGLIEGYYSQPENYNQTRLDWAMGFGYTESTIYDQYRGFYNQVNLGAWQFYWNYKRAQGLGYSGYQVGDTMTFSDWNGDHEVHIDNRATAALYRYTPHVYNGNYNFWYYFNKWFIQKPYSAAWVSQNINPSLFDGDPADPYTFRLTVRNTGSETWYGEGNANPVRLGTNNPLDRTSAFTRGDGWVASNRVKMVEPQVNPGDEAHFIFTYSVPAGTPSGYYRENFRVLAEGKTWMEDQGICWDIRVKTDAEKYHYEIVGGSQSAYPQPMYPEESANFQIILKNTGRKVWYKDGNNSVRFGTDKIQDRIPVFTRGNGWIAPNRVEMVEPEVSPGQTATFNFTYTIPDGTSSGFYREYFRLMSEGMTWMEDYGIYWEIQVKSNAPRYHAEYIGQSNYPELFAGESSKFQLTLKNTGSITWYKSGKANPVRLGTSGDRTPAFIREDRAGGNPSGWVTQNRISMDQEEVKPGESGTFSFYYTVPSDMKPDVYREYFRPVADGLTWMEDYGIYWDVKVKNYTERFQCQLSSQNPYPPLMLPGESYNFQLAILNTGTTTWKGEGNANPVRLGTDKSQNRTPAFIREDRAGGNPSGWVNTNRVKMQENEVSPGGTAHFSFYYTVPSDMKPDIYREYFRPVADGLTWLNDYGIYWDVQVDYPHSQWVAQSNVPTAHAGDKIPVWIEFKNTGGSLWRNSGDHPIRLGTEMPRDRNSFFQDTGWFSANRIVLDQAVVNPNETGRFSFYLNVPLGTPKGHYREYFRPVADGMSWLEDNGVYFDINVE